MKISNEQIIASARRQRQKVLNTIDHSSLNIDHWAPPETVPSKNNGQRSMVNGGLLPQASSASLQATPFMLTCLSHNLPRILWLRLSKCSTTPSCKCRLSATPSTRPASSRSTNQCWQKQKLHQRLRKKTAHRQSRKPAPCCATTFPTNCWRQGDDGLN